MSRIRSIRKKRARNKKGIIELDITSMLDILIILLVFLLKSYNTSGVTISVPEGITLPDSKSESLNTAGIMIQVSKDKIWVDSQTVLDSKAMPKRVYDMNGRRIIPLFNELVKKKELIKATRKQAPGAKKFSGIANLIIDKSLKYSYLKKIMFTCAEAGFRQYKFVVLGEDQ